MNLSILNEKELHRLISAFDAEAVHFHDLRMSTFSIEQGRLGLSRAIADQHHGIMLWQYYGVLKGEEGVEQFVADMEASDFKIVGINGAEMSMYALLEGEMLAKFKRMAERAGSMFEKEAAEDIAQRVVNEVCNQVRRTDSSLKTIAVTNRNPLAVWLNYLLYHLSLVNPNNRGNSQIHPDPFSLSLLALERLEQDQALGKIDRSNSPIDRIEFEVALTFAGAQRGYVAQVVDKIRERLGPDKVFYDHDYQAQLSRPNLDVLLQDIYFRRSRLVVAFLSKEYQDRDRCGIEWRSIRAQIGVRSDDTLMFVRFDDSVVDGVFERDGFHDARVSSPEEIARAIEDRLATVIGGGRGEVLS